MNLLGKEMECMKIYLISKKRMIVALLGIFFLGASILFFNPNNIRTVFYESEPTPIRMGNPNENKMAFTCNVDWGNEVIPDMLKIFEEKGVKITFFVTGRWAEKYPDLLKQIYEKGHEIGNHAYSHKMHSQISENENYLEIKKTEDVILRVLGIKPIYFAPPSGDYNLSTLKVAESLGYKTILWSIDTIDWREDSTSAVIIQRVMKKPHKGAILLMHPKPATVRALPHLIDKIQEEGIQIGTVSDLIK